MKIPDVITMEYLTQINFIGPTGINSNWTRINGIGRVLEKLHSQYPFVVGKTLSELFYCLKHDLNALPTCETCGDNLIWSRDKKGYGTYCSIKCFHINSIAIDKKRVITNLERYGVPRPLQSPEIAEKTRKSHSKRTPKQKASALKKFAKSCLKKFGYDHPLKCPEIKHKTKITLIQKYGMDFWKENMQKAREAVYEKYGTNHARDHIKRNNRNASTKDIKWQLPDVLTDNDI